MKFLLTRKAGRAVAAALAVPLVAVGLASLPWTPARVPTPPRVVATARGAGPLRAGAGEASFALPPGTPIGGFTRLDFSSEGAPGPVGARALVLEEPGCRVALVSAELLLVPDALVAEVAARLSDLALSGLVLGATHTHAGPGGYVDGFVFERLATGPYDPRVREAVVSGIVEAVRRAAAALGPARLATARAAAGDLARSRSGGLEDAPLTAVRVLRADGAPLAELTVFAAHATLLGKRNRTISGDWPGRFLSSGSHGLRLLFQGAIGDQSAEGPASATPEAFAAALSARVDGLLFPAPDPAPPLAFATVAVGLPRAEVAGAPAPLRPAARNLAAQAFPATALVSAVRLGSVLLLALPAEPVSAVSASWRAALPPDAAVVSLANGYLGYVEAPARMEGGGGETVRTYYGPALAATLEGAVHAAAGAADHAASAGRPPP